MGSLKVSELVNLILKEPKVETLMSKETLAQLPQLLTQVKFREDYDIKSFQDVVRHYDEIAQQIEPFIQTPTEQIVFKFYGQEFVLNLVKEMFCVDSPN